LTPLAYGVHHRPERGGALIDIHFHIAIEVEADADLVWLRKYLGGLERVWIDETKRTETPEVLARYLREGAARYVHAFDNEHLAIYVAQVHTDGAPLHRFQTLGPLRRLSGELRRANLRPRQDAEDETRVVLAPPPRRPARRTCWTVGPAILAVRLAWIGDQLRPSLIVRGWRGSWSALTERYDLDAAVGAARAALATHTSTQAPETPEP
jgi:hypothetical protein